MAYKNLSDKTELIAKYIKGNYGAAIAPMQRPTRLEHAITYVSFDWFELVDLLTSPLEFLRSLEFLWPQDPAFKSRVDWQMVPPLTAVLKHYAQDLPTAVDWAADIRAFALSARSSDNKNQAEAVLEATTYENVFQAATQFENPFGEIKGHFIAKLSLYTSVIQITYFPPKEAVIEPYKDNDLDSVTLVTTQKDNITGLDLHYDLKPRHRHNASYLVSHVQDRNWLAKAMTRKAQNGEITITSVDSILPGKQNPPQDTGIMGPGPTISPDTVFKSEYPNPLHESLIPIWPTVVTHGLSSPLDSSSCSVTGVAALIKNREGVIWNSERGGVLTLGGTCHQPYFNSQFDNTRMVTDVLRDVGLIP